MTTQDNKLLVRRFLERTFVEHDLDGAAEMLTRDYYLHDPTRPVFAGGPASYVNAHQPYEDAIENRDFSVDDQVAEGDQVVTRWTLNGTQYADLPGIPNRGKSFLIKGITIVRLFDGLIAEEWQVWDYAGLKQQLSV